jgi:chemotaxis response regulator CheB
MRVPATPAIAALSGVHSVPGRALQVGHELAPARLRGLPCARPHAAADAGRQSERSDKLVLTGTGTGGLDELRSQLDDGRASFAYARVQYANDKESQREKFVLVTWIGPSCKVMRKAKVCAGPPAPRAR